MHKSAQPFDATLQADLNRKHRQVGLPLRRCDLRAAQGEGVLARQLRDDALQLRRRHAAGLAGNQYLAAGLRRAACRRQRQALLLGDKIARGGDLLARRRHAHEWRNRQ